MEEGNRTLHPGFLLGAGKYKIVRLLGSGGFGNTYLAEHVLLGKRVAVKEFFASQFCNRDSDGTSVSLALTGKAGVVAKLRKKFMEEAKALAGLNHPGIVRVNDVFEENGTAYYVMDLIEGKPLSAIVKEKGSLGEEEAVGYIRQVCQALKVVHGRGRLHLDIKPANIMVDGDDRAVLIDFGASKQYDEGSGENTSTFVARTAGYAPLEQGSGSGIKTFSPSTDIYALGATLYKLLSGSTPLDAADLASGEELPPLPAVVSERTKAAVRAAMSLRRGDRPQSVEEFESLLGSGVDRQSKEEDERTEIAGGDAQGSNSSHGKEATTGSSSKGVSSSKPVVPSSSEPKKSSSSKNKNSSLSGSKSSTPSKSSKSSSKQTPSQEDGTNSGKKRKALIGIIVGVAAVVIALGLVMLFGGNGGGSDDVSSATGTIAGHEYVDLGLSVKWATCNIGADNPEEYGNYYAWGETSTKSSYKEGNSKTYKKNYGDIAGISSLDAARANWGSTWRLPTSDEIDELIEKCNWTWTKMNGVKGYKVTSKVNGKSIFLPAAGVCFSSSPSYAGSSGYYWSSTPNISYTIYAYRLYFNSGEMNRYDYYYRYNGYSVRPVSEPANTAVNSSVSGQSENGSAIADTQESQPGAPKTGSMVVNYEPSGATVYVDGTKKGVTPCTVSGVSFGTHKVKVVKSGYESAELSVKVSEGSEPQLKGSLEKEVTVQASSPTTSVPTTGTIEVYYEPTGSTVYIDGTRRGTTPCTVSGVSFGSHKVKIVKSGYESKELSVSMSDGKKPLQLSGNLKKEVAAQTNSSSASTSASTTSTTNSSSSSSSSSGVSSATGTIAGHEYVDLGLSVKWATCNVGARSLKNNGFYYAWGEVAPKTEYTRNNSKTHGYNGYNRDIGGDVSMDTARANWGGTWRLPTRAEFQELIDRCEWRWTTIDGKKGYKITSRVNGRWIFLPFAGRQFGTATYYAGSYWSSTPGSGNRKAYYLEFYGSGDISVRLNDRYDGCSVRPVSH